MVRGIGLRRPEWPRHRPRRAGRGAGRPRGGGARGSPPRGTGPDQPPRPRTARDEAFRKVTRTETPSLVENNRRFHRMLVDGVDVEYRRPDGTHRRRQGLARRLRRPRQQRLAGRQPVHRRRGQAQPPARRRRLRQRPAAGRHRAEEPGRRERHDQEAPSTSSRPTSRRSRACSPATSCWSSPTALEARVGTLTAAWERFMPWRTIDGDDVAPPGHAGARSRCSTAIFDKRRFLDLVRHFIVFEVDGADASQEDGRLPPVPRRQQGRRRDRRAPPRPAATSASASSGTRRAAARA